MKFAFAFPATIALAAVAVVEIAAGGGVKTEKEKTCKRLEKKCLKKGTDYDAFSACLNYMKEDCLSCEAMFPSDKKKKRKCINTAKQVSKKVGLYNEGLKTICEATTCDEDKCQPVVCGYNGKRKEFRNLCVAKLKGATSPCRPRFGTACPEDYNPVVCEGKVYANQCLAERDCLYDEKDCTPVNALPDWKSCRGEPCNPLWCGDDAEPFANECLAKRDGGYEIDDCMMMDVCQEVYDPVMCGNRVYTNECHAVADCVFEGCVPVPDWVDPCDDNCSAVFCNDEPFRNKCLAKYVGGYQNPSEECDVLSCTDEQNPVTCGGDDDDTVYLNECIAKASCAFEGCEPVCDDDCSARFCGDNDEPFRNECIALNLGGYGEPGDCYVLSCSEEQNPVTCADDDTVYQNECYAKASCAFEGCETVCDDNCSALFCNDEPFKNECVALNIGGYQNPSEECDVLSCTDEQNPVTCDGTVYQNECIAKASCAFEGCEPV